MTAQVAAEQGECLMPNVTDVLNEIERLKALSLPNIVQQSEQLPPKCLEGFDDDKFCDRSGECEWCKDIRR